MRNSLFRLLTVLWLLATVALAGLAGGFWWLAGQPRVLAPTATVGFPRSPTPTAVPEIAFVEPQIALAQDNMQQARVVFQKAELGLRAVAVAPDGTLLAGLYAGGAVKVWRLRETRLVAEWQSNLVYPAGITFSLDNQLLWVSGRDKLEPNSAWAGSNFIHQARRLTTGREVFSFTSPRSRISFMPASFDALPQANFNLLFEETYCVSVKSLERYTPGCQGQGLVVHSDEWAFSPNGEYVANTWVSSSGPGMMVMRIDGERLFNGSAAKGLVFSADSRMLAMGGFYQGEVQIWGTPDGVELARWPAGSRSVVTPVAFGPGDRWLATLTAYAADVQVIQFWGVAP